MDLKEFIESCDSNVKEELAKCKDAKESYEVLKKHHVEVDLETLEKLYVSYNVELSDDELGDINGGQFIDDLKDAYINNLKKKIASSVPGANIWAKLFGIDLD